MRVTLGTPHGADDAGDDEAQETLAVAGFLVADGAGSDDGAPVALC